MKALFIDASVTELKKNYLVIAKYIKEREPDFEALFLSVDTASYVVESMELEASRLLTSNGFNVYTEKSFNAQIIERRLNELKSDFLFIDAMNVSNQVWNIVSHKLNIPVYMYPHGFQIDNLFYKKSELLSKVVKVLRYTYGVYQISKLMGRPFSKVYKAYTNYIKKGDALVNTAMDHPLLYPDVVYIYSEYYKEFWHRKYGITDVKYEYIMPLDFTLVPEVLEKPQENALCYITQTLHEDGRYTKEEYKDLLRSYIPLAKSVDCFYIKLHPRVELTMYDEIFADIPSVKIVRDFPNCTCYLTHYSSMAYTGALISGNVIIHELPRQPTHEVYQEVASEITHNVEETINAAKRLMVKPIPSFEDRKKIISKFASYTGISPYETLYKSIFKK